MKCYTHNKNTVVSLYAVDELSQSILSLSPLNPLSTENDTTDSIESVPLLLGERGTSLRTYVPCWWCSSSSVLVTSLTWMGAVCRRL